MQRRAFVIQVSGKRFHSFVLDYIFFANKSYPDADVIVLLDGIFSKKIENGLTFLKNCGFKFKIFKTHFSSMFKMDKNIFKRYMYWRNASFKQCGRFLIKHPCFDDYDCIYIGDADILIVPEDKDLFEQHEKHASFIGFPYSDILREEIKKNNSGFKYSIKCFLKFGFPFIRCKSNNPSTFCVNEMTGLRYIRVKDYFKAVEPNFEFYRDLIASSFEKKDKYQTYTISTFSDQQILFSLMMKSFGSVPERSSTDGIDETNPNCVSYRPHHGIHLKLFKNKECISQNTKIIYSKSYSMYYRAFLMLSTDPVFLELSKFRQGPCKKQILNLINFLKNQ